MEVLGYFMALLSGLVLGLMGGGGSILTVPILAYIFGLNEKIATAYSLFVVGVGALIGALRYYKNSNVHWRIAIMLGTADLLGVLYVRNYVVPLLPDTLFSINGFEFTRRMAMFSIFSILMLSAALMVLVKNKQPVRNTLKKRYNVFILFIQGFLIGLVTGFVGAGGGFLIVPILMFLTGLNTATKALSLG